MRKIYSLLFALLAFAGLANAQVVFDFSTDDAYTLFGLSGFSAAPSGQPAVTDGDITSDVSTTSSDVTITVTANPSGTVNRMWKGSLRLYGGTMTVSASRKNITAIKFTLNSSKWGANNSADCGTLETGSWAGNASTVVITIAANTQIKKMEVFQEGDDTPVKRAHSSTRALTAARKFTSKVRSPRLQRLVLSTSPLVKLMAMQRTASLTMAPLLPNWSCSAALASMVLSWLKATSMSATK